MIIFESMDSIYGKMPMQLNWDDFAYFLAVVRGGSLSAAAAEMGTSASTVSRHIDALEARLGLSLFLRQPRGYVLSDTGTELLARVSEVERAVKAVERMGAVASDVAGEIKIAAPESIANYLILPHLPELLREHPGLRIELLVTRFRTDLARREADIAVRSIVPGQHDFAPDAIARQVGSFHFGLYGAESLLRSVSDWRTLPHVSWDASWTKLPMIEWLQDFFPKQAPAMRSNSMQANYLAARAGVGVAMLPRFMVQREGGLVQIDADMSHTQHELWLLYHQDLKGSDKVRVIKRFLETTLRGSS